MTAAKLALTALFVAISISALCGCEPGRIGSEQQDDASGAQLDGLAADAHSPSADAAAAPDSASTVDSSADSSTDGSVPLPPPPPPCAPIPGAKYATLSPSVKTDRPAAVHGDINMLLRQRRPASATLGLVNVNGPTDPALPPQLHTLFGDERVPTFSAVYQVQGWHWGCNCPKGWVSSPAVTLAGMASSAGEVIHTPSSSYDIGNGRTAMVLYASERTITLKYTREDNVVSGYTIHIDNICVEPSLLSLYRSLDAAGRSALPALDPRQPLGRARGAELRVAIRDTGAWMDPRVRKDWWQGK